VQRWVAADPIARALDRAHDRCRVAPAERSEKSCFERFEAALRPLPVDEGSELVDPALLAQGGRCGSRKKRL